MSLRRLIAVAALAAAVSLAGLGCSQDKSSTISIGAMPPGTSWYVFAATLANLLQESVPHGTRVEVIARGGGIGNPILVDRGQETIAISQAATSAWAYSGHPVAYEGRKHENIRALAGGLNRVWMAAILTEDYIERTGHDTVEGAVLSDGPLRVVMKPHGSTVPVVAEILFETLGTSRAKILANGGGVIQGSANQIPTILRDGRADLYLETAIRGHPTLTEVATTTDVRFLDYPDAVIEKLVAPGITRTPMPQWFRGQLGNIDSVDMGTVLITHKDLSPDLAYLITKTICENSDAMAAAHRAWEDFEPEKGGLPEKTGVPLHPGAERYFKERGWL
ncbi:MAG: TAXI family TRAP transporter solute-binding subunit [Bryobacterales bacterium]|nr:TAXI family TRAP transporter solute-binding subunit [Bryobacterales bacterium]